MEDANIFREWDSLPPEARKLVGDYVALLKSRYPKAASGKKMRRTKLADEPFIGMWRDSADMRDSAEWVRDLRGREWGLDK